MGDEIRVGDRTCAVDTVEDSLARQDAVVGQFAGGDARYRDGRHRGEGVAEEETAAFVRDD
jgi:hypothetical protein